MVFSYFLLHYVTSLVVSMSFFYVWVFEFLSPIDRHEHILCAGLTNAGPQRGLSLFVSWGAAVTPEASHSFSAQTLTRRLVAPSTHCSQRMALTSC